MFVLDTLLAAPLHGMLWLVQEIQDAADQEMDREADDITGQLQTLYFALEKGEITEQQFDAREAELLDRLAEIQDHGGVVE